MTYTHWWSPRMGLDFLHCVVIIFYYIIEAPVLKFLKKPKSLRGNTVLVTGSARGLGMEISLKLASEGCRLICIDINKAGLNEVVNKINDKHGDGAAIGFVVNVADKQEVYKLAENLQKSSIQVDILVNNAGIVKAAPLLEEKDEIIERVLAVNLTSQFWTIKAFLPGMLERRRGHIVSISSMISFTCAENTAVYAASKYGVTGLMNCLREELRRQKNRNIKITTVHPFFLDSSPYNVEHWKIDSKMPDLNIQTVANYVVHGIKYEEEIVSIPKFIHLTLDFLRFLPTKAGELFQDTFYANINNL